MATFAGRSSTTCARGRQEGEGQRTAPELSDIVSAPPGYCGPPAGGNHRGATTQEEGLVFCELPVLIVIVSVIALLIKTFLLQAFYIPSASMEPT